MSKPRLGEPEELIACGYCNARAGEPCTMWRTTGIDYLDRRQTGWERGVHIQRQQDWKEHQGFLKAVWEASQVEPK